MKYSLPDTPFGNDIAAWLEVRSDEEIAKAFEEYAIESIEKYQSYCSVLEKEVAGLNAARFAYASEFKLDPEGQPDIGSIHRNIRALKASNIELIEAVKRMIGSLGVMIGDPDYDGDVVFARAAISKAEKL